MPNKLSRFWYEVKRRNVHRLMAIYAGTAYVIFEASTLIFPRWGLPEWTIDLVLYLLILGAIITFVVSWIYDITPEGIRKTKPVSELQESEVRTTPNGWKIASYISFVVIVGLILLNILPRNKRTEEITDLEKPIAILPFKNISPDSENQYLLDGIMEAIINYLTKVENVRVIASTSVERYRGTDKPISEIGKELNVNYILEGSGQKYDENFRLTTKLSESHDGSLIWSNSYDREIQDILDVQMEIAHKIVSELQVKLNSNDRENLRKRPTFSEEAYQKYLLAQRIRNSNYINAIELVKEAIEIDPLFGEAYVRLSNLYMWGTSTNLRMFSTSEALGLAVPHLEKALEIDPNNYKAHGQFGDIKYWLEWDFKGAEIEYLVGEDISGNYNHQYVSLLIQNRRYEEALEQTLKIREQVPLFKPGWIRLPYLFLGEYDKALEIFFKEQDGVKGKGGYWIGRIYMAMGDYDQAIIEMEHTVEKSRAPFWLSDLAICYNIIGEKTKANEIINELIERYDQGEHGSIAFMLGKIYSGLGKVELALDWLERSYRDHELEMIWLYADPAFGGLQDNEHYLDLLKRVGFDV